MSDASDLVRYYARRVAEYEQVYLKPERQEDLARLRERVPTLLEGRRVLEVACGTGYWTALVAPKAGAILATDASPDVLAYARAKGLPAEKVRFAEADAYTLAGVAGAFDGGLGAFWWSHVPRERLGGFLASFHARLAPGARVVWLDNRYVAGSSTPLAGRDAQGNTYQRRMLADGSEHEVLKNYPDEGELCQVLAPWSATLHLEMLPYYWLAWYDLGERQTSSEWSAHDP